MHVIARGPHRALQTSENIDNEPMTTLDSQVLDTGGDAAIVSVVG